MDVSSPPGLRRLGSCAPLNRNDLQIGAQEGFNTRTKGCRPGIPFLWTFSLPANSGELAGSENVQRNGMPGRQPLVLVLKQDLLSAALQMPAAAQRAE